MEKLFSNPLTGTKVPERLISDICNLQFASPNEFFMDVYIDNK